MAKNNAPTMKITFGVKKKGKAKKHRNKRDTFKAYNSQGR